MAGNGTTLRGTVTYGTGKYGSALTSGVLSIPTPASSAAATVEMWTSINSTSTVFVAFGNNHTGTNGFWLGISNGFASFAITGANDYYRSTGPQIGNGAFHHLAVTYDGSVYRLWVDGTNVTVKLTQNSSDPGSTSAPGSGAFTLGTGTTAIGGFGATGGFDWAGAIDEVRLSTVARYASTFTPAAPGADSNTQGLYHLDGDATDSSVAAQTAPGAPTVGTATAGAGSASVPFAPPASNGNSAITSYTATSAPGGVTGTAASSPVTVSGLTEGTSYTFTVRATNAVGSGPDSAASNAVVPTAAPTGTTIAPNNANITYSPGTWDVTSTRAKTINPGAYFLVTLAGSPAGITLRLDTTGLASPYPVLKVRVDQGGWQVQQMAAGTGGVYTFSPAIPSNGWATHTLEVVVAATSEFVTRWTTQQAHVSLLGITTTNNGVSTTAGPTRALKALCLGDSIGEGYKALADSTDPAGSDSTQAWAWGLRDTLGAEVGVVCFGGQGWNGSGQGGVPPLPTAVQNLWGSGPARTFTEYDLVVINMGENDGATDTTSTVTAMLNTLLTAVSSACRIAVVRPLSGKQASFLQAGVAACSAPGRVRYVTSAGWFTSADSPDGVHPWGYTNTSSVIPRLASALRSLVLNRSGRYVNVAGTAKPVASVIR